MYVHARVHPPVPVHLRRCPPLPLDPPADFIRQQEMAVYNHAHVHARSVMGKTDPGRGEDESQTGEGGRRYREGEPAISESCRKPPLLKDGWKQGPVGDRDVEGALHDLYWLRVEGKLGGGGQGQIWRLEGGKVAKALDTEHSIGGVGITCTPSLLIRESIRRALLPFSPPAGLVSFIAALCNGASAEQALKHEWLTPPPPAAMHMPRPVAAAPPPPPLIMPPPAPPPAPPPTPIPAR
ncbi:unnamed protein product [Vitrella brassicaformis CCMP3155]|uniref:Uncharacterized protein n=1 Tax=Vitrella brassicaformis (strain CCMP3155) TaxID=1169540 RepID=A0A0G4EEA0_VITBC|nr:unnamed protein product [Vitrella brassicaformis CCMP3155]|eukprot:CEL93879.1 unnamed protein product [Vitrella brassicaformis CCMP3155]